MDLGEMPTPAIVALSLALFAAALKLGFDFVVKVMEYFSARAENQTPKDGSNPPRSRAKRDSAQISEMERLLVEIHAVILEMRPLTLELHAWHNQRDADGFLRWHGRRDLMERLIVTNEKINETQIELTLGIRQLTEIVRDLRQR